MQSSEAFVQWVRTSLEISHGYATDCVTDIPDERLAEQPQGVKNHGAWTLAHLGVGLQLAGDLIGAGAWLPQNWTTRFGTGSIPEPDRSKYPELSEMFAALHDGRESVVARLEVGGPALLAEELKNDVLKPYLPTLGHVVTQILVAHTAYHVGQLQVWRRAMGFGGVGYPYL